MTKMYFWYYLVAPKEIHRALYNWSPFTAYRVIFKSMWDSSAAARDRSHRFIRDVFKAWNREWLPEKPRNAVTVVSAAEEVAPERRYNVRKATT
jgi:hypothetical protein